MNRYCHSQRPCSNRMSTNLQKQIDDLEAALIADLATDPKARELNIRLASELNTALVQLRDGKADGLLFLRAAETCRTLAADTTDLMIKSNLQSLATALRESPRDVKRSSLPARYRL